MILGSWSGMRKYLEQDMIAPALRGRVRYNCTHYVGMDSDRIFEVFIDGKLFKRFSLETLNAYFIKMGLAEKQHPMSLPDYWHDYRKLCDRYPPDRRTEYTDDEFCRALEKYRSGGIADSLRSDDAIVRMFALFDRRVGRRTLEKLKDSIGDAPEWVREAYRIRVNASGTEKEAAT